jgi:cell division protein FtsB
MKKKTQLQSALELAKAVRGAAPVEAGILDIDLHAAQPVKVNKNLAAAALKKLNTPKTRRAVAVVAGVAAVSAAVNSIGKYQFYRSAVAKEMKKQLAPLKAQISALQASVDALRAENAVLRGESVPEPEQAPKARRRHGK